MAAADETTRNFERGHQAPTSLQGALLPEALPAFAAARLDWAYRPAEGDAEVCGDWYDAFLSPTGSLFVSIGDVAGHGFEAALAMGSIRKLLRTLAFEDDDPAAVLERASRVVLAEEGETLATALVGRLDPGSLRFDYACAGHVPPILVLPEGLANRIDGGGLPLGVAGPNPVEHHTLELTPGAALCLYTDGLVQFDRDMIEAEQRLHHLLAQSVGFGELTATLIVDRMLGGKRRTDDVAVLVVQAKGQPLACIDTALPSIPRSAATVRGLIRRFADTHGLDADAYFRLLVVAGEAVANAAEHAYDDAEDALRLTACRVADLVRIVVWDRGRWPARREEHRGRGLALIETLSEELEIQTGPAGTRLSATVRVNAS